MAEANPARAYALAVRYISVRMRSRKEMTDYLEGKGCPADEIEDAIGRLEELSLIDDLQFARAWIEGRMSLRPRSRQRLAQELAAKGVPREVVQTALADVEPDQELDSLVEVIRRKQRLGGYQDNQKLVGYLQRQGYRWDLIKAALERIQNAD